MQVAKRLVFGSEESSQQQSAFRQPLRTWFCLACELGHSHDVNNIVAILNVRDMLDSGPVR